MTARVLIVDDILTNIKLLEARLSAEYFQVVTAHSGQEALDLLGNERVDVILLDVMMPGMDGFEVCRRLKSTPATHHIPVIMVTALDHHSDKVQGLEAGADDFLTKPVDDIALITRVRNLVRLKTLNDQMMLRMAADAPSAVLADTLVGESSEAGRILMVEDRARSAQRVASTLGKRHVVDLDSDLQSAMQKLSTGEYDLVIVSLGLLSADGLRLCGQVRSLERTRHLPIIVIVEPGDEARLLRSLDMGVNDYVTRPVDRHELTARVRTQIKRKRHTDQLRDRIEESVELALTDALTGLHNRWYMERHLKKLVDQAKAETNPLSVLVVDIDNFKSINDTYGHAAGDSVLREFASRFRRNIRGIDLACRLGGEEFVVIMPDTAIDRACQIGERLRSCIASDPFLINITTQLRVTASVGVATLEPEDATSEPLFKRADNALYVAKRDGRNRVVADAA
jgi:two-component system cell cycle response regulator